MKRTLLFVTTLAFALACHLPAFAQEKPATSESEAPKKRPAPKSLPFRGVVEAVDTKEMTISLKGREKPRVFHVTSKTRFEKDAKPALFADVKVGENLQGSYERTDTGDNLIRVIAGVTPKPAQRKEKSEQSEKTEKATK